MKKLTNTQRAYIAGFLDGDGSIYVRLKPNKTYRFRYQVAPYIVFFQSQKERAGLMNIHNMLGVGYVRDRNDGVVEYIIGDVASIKYVLHSLLPYLSLKEQQAQIMLKILQKKERVKTAHDFLGLCELIDLFKKLNYSKRRVNTCEAVRKTLRYEGLLTP